MSETIPDRVRRVIADEFGEKVEDLADNKRFFEDLQGDSLDEVSLAVALEDEFGIEVSDHDARKLRTVKDVCDYVERHAKQEAITQ
jgi:acyl carrier protein